MKDDISTIKDIIEYKCDIYKDKVAVIDKNRRNNNFYEIKYSKLKEDVIALGTILIRKLNLEDEKIAVIGENSYSWLITYLSVISGVGVIVPLDKELPDNEIINLIKRSKAKCIVFSEKKEEVINNIKDKLSKEIIFINMNKFNHSEECYSLDKLIEEGNELVKKGDNYYMSKELDENKFAALLFTSGTTSKSKGVMLSNKNLASNVSSIKNDYESQTGSRFLSFLPMHHTYEFTITYLCNLAYGGTIGISRGLRYLLEDMKIIKPEGMAMVPLLLENIKRKIEKKIREENKEVLVNTFKGVTNVLDKFNINIKRSVFKQIHDTFGGNLKYIFCGGAPADKATIDAMESYGFAVFQGYGLTETSPLVAGTRYNDRRAGTVGKPISNVEVRIDILPNEEENSGEIMVKGPNVMLGYYEDEEATKQVLKKNWFYTGDIGYFDSKGNLVVSGRTKNVIVTSNGKNIYPEEIENYLNRINYVEDSLVYGEGENRNLTVVAKLKLDDAYIKEKFKNNIPNDEEMHDILWNEVKKVNRKLSTYKAVKKIIIKKDDFVKTTTMKIKRQEEINK